MTQSFFPSRQLGQLADHGTADCIPVTAKVLARRVHEEIGPSVEGRVATGIAIVESTDSLAPQALTIPAMTTISVNFRMGLAGVSTWMRRVSDRTAAGRHEIGHSNGRLHFRTRRRGRAHAPRGGLGPGAKAIASSPSTCSRTTAVYSATIWTRTARTALHDHARPA